MRNNIETIRPKTRVEWLSTVDMGRRLEVSAELNDTAYELLSVVADEKDGSLWVEFFVEGKCFQIPLHILKDAINVAPEGVHSENWYEKHVYSKKSPNESDV